MRFPIYQHVLEEVVKAGVKEFCLCPGSRNSPLIDCLVKSSGLKMHFWYEERSAAFFALGRARATGLPVAVVTTSGTAAGELLPAAMEAHYTGVPLLLLTADRPRRFRGTGAPQTAEQENLFGLYAHFAQDIEGDEQCRLLEWDYSGPAHLNICLEEPKSYSLVYQDLFPCIPQSMINRLSLPYTDLTPLKLFFQQSHRPLVIVGTLRKECRSAVLDFLLRMKAPVYCEAASGLREEARLKHLQIRVESAVWKLAKTNGYEIDGILRIGGVPVTRIWRDLEDRVGQLVECSLSEVPLSGLSWGTHIQAHLDKVLSRFQIPLEWKCADFNLWMQADVEREKQIQGFFDRFPTSEPALYRSLSQQISPNSLVYLGNSLPVREWDLTAILESRQIEIQMNRGLNGIDGQLSTFLGLCQKGRENWAILGDLTTLYDFPALWILASLNEIPIKIVVMNNGGGKLFARIYTDPIFQHLHNFDFEYFAKSWRVPYLLTSSLNEADMKELPLQAFVEVCPDPQQTELFWKAYDELR